MDKCCWVRLDENTSEDLVEELRWQEFEEKG